MKRQIVLSETGGTFSMGMVRGELLKKLNYSGVKDIEKYAVPLYDIRHFVLAAKIVSSDLSESKKDNLLVELVEEAEKYLLEEKITNKKSEKHLRFLNDIAKKISSNSSVEEIKREYALSSNIIKPYRIDSIDFSLNEHYPILLQTSLEVLKNTNSTLIVIGGTDTLEFYAGLLARDLNKRGFFCPERNNNVIFLSSMLSFGYDSDLLSSNKSKAVYPAHIGKYLLSAIKFSQESQGGAYTLSATDESASIVVVHDVLSHFVKISSVVPNAFRSSNQLGNITIDDQKISFLKNPFSPARNYTCDEKSISFSQLTKVAPPIINSDIQTLSKFLRSIISTNHNFQVIPIELDQNLLKELYKASPKTLESILNLIINLTSRGIKIQWFNEISFNPISGVIENSYNLEQLQEFNYFNSLFSNIQNMDISQNNTMIGLYLDLLLQNVTSLPFKAISIDIDEAKVPVFGIKYIPDDDSFTQMLSLVNKFSNNLVISALPGESIPIRHLETIKDLVNNKTNVYLSFRYNGIQHNLENYNVIEGSLENHYAAAQGFQNVTAHCGILSPEKMIVSIRNQNPIYSLLTHCISESKNAFFIGFTSGLTSHLVENMWGKNQGELASKIVSIATMLALEYPHFGIATYIAAHFVLRSFGVSRRQSTLMSWTLMLLSSVVDKNFSINNFLISTLIGIIANLAGERVAETIVRISLNGARFLQGMNHRNRELPNRNSQPIINR